ncbi:hypothetical protein [Nostoc sp. 'Lobaria pulmonaria (5183) cyanobiont']|uniref:hypothetical protein n=1 Tax=Nostoc sp. 'Lobaria pulmonaria (5183) cyanobiont' TaxID=1618022 RepID=UPI000CF3578A|nr:hypothetical protein [Nostoc sp. 'Lobaria pulmonaria (5183) cyanobiont']AVH72444.1 protein of unknown function DUF4435 [Nostoc sp. 'Lobaria pulmonaria (5183) cyanobiont']
MENEIRRTLDELVTRYELEPDLRDIYVEGKTDKLLIEWFLDQKKNQGFAVYEIDTVEIPAQLLFEQGLKDNNRSRVITLALYINDKLSETSLHITCVADKDFDWLFCKEYQCDLLLFTDYSCLEMYLFNEAVLDKCLRLGLGLSQPKAREVLNQLSRVLEDLFLIRDTNEALNLNMRWLDKFGDCCKLNKKDYQVQFELKTFITKYLNSNSNRSQESRFITKLEELRAKKLIEIRYKIHGHDFTELLCWYIRPYLGTEIRSSYNSEILARSLLACIDADKLSQEGLFQRLLARIDR